MTISNPFKPHPRVYKEAKSLAKAGHEVIVIAWDREGRYPKEEEVEGFRVIRVGPKARYGFRMAFKLPLFYIRTFLLLLKLKPEIVHTYDFDTALMGLLMKLLKKTGWVYDIQDLYFTFFSMEGQKLTFLGRIVQKIDFLFAKLSDRNIVATQSIGGKYEGLREYYIRLGVRPEKIVTVWNVPEVENFLNYLDLKLKKPKKFTIGFIGTLRTLSNFLILFDAVKDETSRYKILLVGEGKQTEKLKEIVKKHYPNLDVEFVGNIDYRLIPNYYKLCDVIFSWYPPRENVKRAIAIKVFEAAALGIPSIVNANSLMEDFVKEYRCGVAIKRLTPDDLKSAIDKSGYIKFKPQKITSRWTWTNEAKKLLTLIGEVGNSI